MAYPPTEDLVELAGVPELSAAPPERQEAYRLLAIAAIEAYTLQSFDLWSGALALDGNGNQVLWLPRRLVDLTSIDAGSISPSDVDVLDDDTRNRVRIRSYGANYYERTMRLADNFRPLWPRGFSNVTLGGSWGYEECPEEIVQALAADMGDQARGDEAPLTSSVDAMRRAGLASYSQGNLAMSWRADSDGASIALSPRAQRLVPDRLVWASAPGGQA